VPGTAFGPRSAASMPVQDAGLNKASRNALDRDTIRNALQDVDVVIQTLGGGRRQRGRQTGARVSFGSKNLPPPEAGNTQVISIERLEIQNGAQAVVGAVLRSET